MQLFYPTLRQGIAILCFFTALLLPGVLKAQIIVADDLQGNFVSIVGTVPETNSPGASWQMATGWSYNQMLYPASDAGGKRWRASNGVAAVLPLAPNGSYTKPSVLKISAEVYMVTVSGGVSPWITLGFYDAIQSVDGGILSSKTNLTGVVLNYDGSLGLYDDGVLVSGSTVAFGGTFQRSQYYTLTYTVNTTSGAISGLSLSGSTADYTALMSAGAPFTDAKTAYAGMGAASDVTTLRGSGRFRNFSLEAMPVQPVISPFGLSQNASITGYATWIPSIAEAGVEGFRYFHEWNGIEPTNGTFSFSSADTYVSTLDTNGIEAGGVLAYSASWTASSHHEFPVNNLVDWAEYVGAVVTRYDGMTRPAVSYWEVWNEPNATSFNTGNRPASDYAQIVRAAYTAAKAANPDCKIGLTIANFDVRYLSQVIDALAAQGAAGSFDFIAVHPYELVNRMHAPDGELQYLNIVPSLRAMLAVHAPTKVDVPIRFTELGARIGDNLQGDTCDASLAARLLIKAYVLGIVQGAEQIAWFEGKDPTGTTSSGQYGFGLLDVNLNKRPAWYAYRAMTDALGATPAYKGWLALGSAANGYGLVFAGSGSDVMAAWTPKGETASVSFGATVQIVDIYTGAVTTGTSITLTEKPVFIRNLPAAMGSLAATNKSLPYPWGSAPLSSTRAEIALGAVSLASGVETDRAYTLVANGTGTNGVIVNQSGTGMYLSVSPSFAGFATHDVYVRVSARQTALRPAGTYSGMNLFYQPTTGSSTAAPQYPYKNKAQWFGLANNTSVQTYTWHLTDAMFVHTFGHAFYFQFDASVPFVIDKVEVSKTPF